MQTPAFIFCATKAAIKGVSAETVSWGYDIIRRTTSIGTHFLLRLCVFTHVSYSIVLCYISFHGRSRDAPPCFRGIVDIFAFFCVFVSSWLCSSFLFSGFFYCSCIFSFRLLPFLPPFPTVSTCVQSVHSVGNVLLTSLAYILAFLYAAVAVGGNTKRPCALTRLLFRVFCRNSSP